MSCFKVHFRIEFVLAANPLIQRVVFASLLKHVPLACMCVCVHTCVRACMPVHACACLCMHACVRAYVRASWTPVNCSCSLCINSVEGLGFV